MWRRWGSRLSTGLIIVLCSALLLGVTPAAAESVGTQHSASGLPISALDSLPDVKPIAIGGSSKGVVSAPRSASGTITVGAPSGKDEIGIGLPVRGDAEALVSPGGSANYMDSVGDLGVAVQSADAGDPKVSGTVRTLLTIGSGRAPSRYEFPLDLSAGSSASVTSDGGVLIARRDGGVIGFVARPWAVDAVGKDLPTHFEIRGDVLIQHVDHRDAVYPVVADPWWFVLVYVVGRQAAIKMSVKAASKKLVEKAAKNALKTHGQKLKSIGATIRGNFHTAGGFVIRLGDKPLKKHGFDSFGKFKEKWGGAGKDREWHHIVEQSALKRTQNRPEKWEIHNRFNIVSIPAGIHRKCISALMGTAMKNIPAWQLAKLGLSAEGVSDFTLRKVLDGYSFRNAHLYGIRLLSLCGVKVG